MSIREFIARITGAAVLITLIVLVAGCTADSPPLLGHDYTAWEQTTTAVLDFPVPGHGDGLRQIYANPAVFETVLNADGSITYPAGAIFVKEVYASSNPDPDAEPAMLLGMVKRPDDEHARGGWVWISRDPESGAETLFDDEFCVTCHANANESHPYGTGNPTEAFRDYVFHTPAVELTAGDGGVPQ